MKVAVFGTKSVSTPAAPHDVTNQRKQNKQYDNDSFDAANPSDSGIEFSYLDARLDATTALLASGHEAVCIFVNDHCDASVCEELAQHGVVRNTIYTSISMY
jgi:hypothetical protein